MMTSLDITLAGETVRLWPERAMSWQHTVFIADPHFGKAAAFRAFGIAAPDGTAADLRRLSELLATTHVNQLVVLGDFFHARAGVSQAMIEALVEWRGRHAGLEIVLVRGNHDLASGDPPAALKIHCAAEPWSLGPFQCCHVPRASATGYVLAGHVHPGVVLRERSGARLRMPGFVVGAHTSILPAFGSFTGLKEVDFEEVTRVFAVTPEGVLEIQRPAKIK